MTISKPSHNCPHSVLEEIHKSCRGLLPRLLLAKQKLQLPGGGGVEMTRLSLLLGNGGYQWAWRVWKEGHTFPMTKGFPSVKCSAKYKFCIIRWGLNLGSTMASCVT